MKRYFEILIGGSGSWQAREVFSVWPFGNINKETATGWVYTGHCPKKAPDTVLMAQLLRQVNGEIPTKFPGLRGGHEIHAVLENGHMTEDWAWTGIPSAVEAVRP